MADQQSARKGIPDAVQMEIKYGAEDLKRYMRELKQWEKEINRKDQELLRQKLASKVQAEASSIDPAGLASALRPEPGSDDIPALEDVDDDHPEIEEQIRKQKAELEKEKGNTYLKANDVDGAIKCYTRGLTFDSDNPLLHANRAMAFLKNFRYVEAETDCDAAIRLDPKHTKAFMRRAAARSAIGKHALARDDLMQVLRLEPKNRQAIQELAKVDNILNDENESGRSIVMPIDKPEHLRSKAPLRRIKIVLDSGDGNSKSNSSQNLPERRQPKIKHDTPTSNAPMMTLMPTRKPNVPTVNQDLTWFQFQKEFRRLKNHPDVLYGYIKQIPAEKYPQLFQHSLESDILSHLLKSYHDYYLPNGDDIYPLLLHLSKTKRFATIRMFLSSEDKIALSDLFTKLLETTDKYDLESLRNAYGMQ